MKDWIEEYAILRKFIEKYCEEQDKNRLIEILNMKDRFLFKYFVNEFSKLKIPNKMTEEELIKAHINQSISHVDFMIGDAEMDIDGILEDGTKIPVFRKGNWAF